MSRKLTTALAALLLVGVGHANADTFTTPLDDLERFYGGSAGTTGQSSFDFGVLFSSVSQATLHLEGTTENLRQTDRPRPYTTLAFSEVMLDGADSPDMRTTIFSEGRSVPFEVNLPLDFDDTVFDGSGDFSFRLTTLSFRSSAGSNVTDATLIFDAISLPLPGDFDVDGDVDGFDFLEWQRNTSIGLLSNWKASYGNTAPLAAITAVPEPTGLILALVALCMACRRP